ncbi:MAG: hypothetical protein OEP95_05250 [Myxococcales bacterium]|nr:hypothetical protein [Myxococcales bacterium]
MRDQPPLVLTASVSHGERRSLESTFKDAGLEAHGVDRANDADGEIAGHDGPSVLVIDSGLLEMPHDAQWRDLRKRHADLGAVVRCLVRGNPGAERTNERTFHVHPDHLEELISAIRTLGSATQDG